MGKIKELLGKLPAWSLSALCLAAILWLTLAPRPLGDTELELFPGADKAVHFLMFAGFSFCIVVDGMRRCNWRRPSARLCLLSFAASAALALATEALQQWMDMGRTGDPADIIADLLGAAAVAAAAAIRK